MKESWLKKAAVCGIILLFVATCAVPGMSDIIKKSNKNAAVLLDDGLEAYWSFNNQDNPGYDDSGNNNQGTVNGATWASNGIIKGAMSFDGDDFISLPDFTSSDSEGTMVAWVKQSLPTGQAGLIYAEGSQSSNKPYIAFGFNGSKLFFARDIHGTTSNYQGKVDVGANDGQWHFVAFSADITTNHFYFDGQEVNLTWQDGNVPDGIWFGDQDTNTNSIGVCDRPDHWVFFNGTIDEARIYNRALSQGEIFDLYNILEFNIQGGLGVNLIITNNGTANAMDVDWQIHVQGGILGRIDMTYSSTIDSIAPGDSIKVGTGMFFGFGTIQITANVDEETKTANGTQLIIFTKV
jgi:hypothetical protein